MTDLAAVVRFIHLTGAVLLAGCFSFMLLVARPAYLAAGSEAQAEYSSFLRHQLRFAGGYWFIVLISILLGLWLQTLAVSETPANWSFDIAATVTLITATHYGNVWLIRMAFLLAAGALLFCSLSRRAAIDSLAFSSAGFSVTLCLLVSVAFAGHAAATEGSAFAVQVTAHALHLSASAVWFGGLAPLAMFLRQCVRRADSRAYASAATATRRFSTLASASVAVLIATGAYNAWNLVGGFPLLFGTAYGNWLLLKLALLLPLLGVGAINSLWFKPIIVASDGIQQNASVPINRLVLNMAIEFALGLGILLIVGYLGVTPPARHIQPDWPFSFRYDWSILDKAPKAASEASRGMVWAAIGGAVLIIAVVRRRRRMLTAAIGVGALVYAATVIDAAISTDAYPTTYLRPAVRYHAISVANGKHFYRESCVTCHGVNGYGDGPAALKLQKKPVDLTAAHVNNHTAGDLFWWLTYGIEGTPMPGFRATLDDEERWDVINFLRALSSGEKARELAPVIENEPWLVAPDFNYGLSTGEMKTLKDHREARIVLLVLFASSKSHDRLADLANASKRFHRSDVEILLVPHDFDKQTALASLPMPIVTEGGREIVETYKLFARSFADEGSVAGTPHVEFLIDKQGYIRARWLPSQGDAWSNLDRLTSQIELLKKEKPRAPAPDDHVH